MSPIYLFSPFQCEPGLGASVMYNLLYNNPQKLMLLAGCSTVCTTVAEAAKMWNLIVVIIIPLSSPILLGCPLLLANNTADGRHDTLSLANTDKHILGIYVIKQSLKAPLL